MWGNSISPSGQQMIVAEELDMYLHLPIEAINLLPLTWWKSQDNKFPALHKVARKFHAFVQLVLHLKNFLALVTSSKSCLKPHRVNQLVSVSKTCIINFRNFVTILCNIVVINKTIYCAL